MSSTSYMLRVGAVTLLAIILLAAALFVIKGGDLLERLTHVRYVLEFAEIQGPSTGMEIKLGGEVIGQVKDSQFIREQGLTRSNISLRREIELFPGTVFIVTSSGLISDVYLEPRFPRFNPDGKPWREEDRLKPGTLIPGRMAPNPLETIAQLGEPLGNILDRVDTMLSEEQLGGIFANLSTSIDETLTSVNSLFGMAEGFMEENEGNVSASMVNMRQISESFLRVSHDLEETSAAVKAMAADPRYREMSDKVLTDLSQATTAINHMAFQIDSLVSDPLLQQDAKDSVRLTKETLQEAKDTMERFQTTLDTVDETMKSAQGLLGEAEGAVTDVRSKVDQMSSIGDSVDVKLGLNVRAVDINDDQALGNEDVYVGDLNAAVGYGNSYVAVGADNIGEDSNANFLLGYGGLTGFSVRGGVYRGELGLGPAYYFAGGGGAELMLYDTEDPKVNGYGYLPVGDHVNVVLGVEDIENDPQASVGVGVEF